MRTPWAAALLFLLLLCSGDARPQDEPEGDAGPNEGAAREGPPPGIDTEARKQWLRARIDDAVAAYPELAGTRIGIAVVDVATGERLYGRADDQQFNVASVVKLVTSAAALATLGPEYRYQTGLYAERWRPGQDAVGDLYLRGAGDPTLDVTALRGLCAELRHLGLVRVRGSLVIDSSAFDGERSPPAFAQKLEDGAFRAPVAAVSVNYNSVVVRVQPGRAPGDAAVVILNAPSDYLVVVNSAVTVGDGRTAIQVAARTVPGAAKRTEIVVKGQIRADAAPRRYKKRVEHPEAYAGETLRALLREAGIEVARRPLVVRALPATAQLLAAHESEPLGVIVRELNKRSNNFVAEMVLKVMGGVPATWPAGVAIVTAWLAAAGVPAGSYRYDNGSGLYDSNRFTPGQITSVLRVGARDFRWGVEYVASLALAGADGTLSHRLVETAAARHVRAKSGTLETVSCLAGLAGAEGAPTLAFAVLVNDLPAKGEGARAARALQDQIAEDLVLYLKSDR